MGRALQGGAVNGTLDGLTHTRTHAAANKQKSHGSRLFLQETPSQMS